MLTADLSNHPIPSTAELPAHAIACMEIWGGNHASQNAVSTPGIDAWVYARPYQCHQAGGDIHYVSLCSAGKIGRFVVADVAGHGSEASELAIALRRLMRKHINTLDQAAFTRALNKEFGLTDSAGRFATALLASYFTRTDQLVLCNAGHPRPLWWRAADHSWRVLSEADDAASRSADNLPLGIIDPTGYSQFAVKLGKGDLVLLYTDSITESTDPNGNMLGEDGLMHLVGALDASEPESLTMRLMQALSRFTGGVEPQDDVTVLLLHHNAAEPPRYSLRQKAAMLGRAFGAFAQP